MAKVNLEILENNASVLKEYLSTEELAAYEQFEIGHHEHPLVCPPSFWVREEMPKDWKPQNYEKLAAFCNPEKWVADSRTSSEAYPGGKDGEWLFDNQTHHFYRNVEDGSESTYSPERNLEQMVTEEWYKGCSIVIHQPSLEKWVQCIKDKYLKEYSPEAILKQEEQKTKRQEQEEKTKSDKEVAKKLKEQTLPPLLARFEKVKDQYMHPKGVRQHTWLTEDKLKTLSSIDYWLENKKEFRVRMIKEIEESLIILEKSIKPTNGGGGGGAPKKVLPPIKRK